MILKKAFKKNNFKMLYLILGDYTLYFNITMLEMDSYCVVMHQTVKLNDKIKQCSCILMRFKQLRIVVRSLFSEINLDY